MHILLLEPDKIQASSITTALERDDHTVKHVISAQSAIQSADDHAPDLVILEMQMPRHNGVEFLYEFRSYHEWLHVPVIVHSYTPPRELTRAATLSRELGVIHTLYKPQTSLNMLRDLVRKVTVTVAS